VLFALADERLGRIDDQRARFLFDQEVVLLDADR
jgi:hypothetical protein